jgi:hypothetical protein
LPDPDRGERLPQHRAPIVADDQRPGQKPESFDHSPKVRSIGPTSGW